MSRRATNRWDWTVVLECPDNEPDDVYLAMDARATNADCEMEVIDIDECPTCGAALDELRQQTPHEILD